MSTRLMVMVLMTAVCLLQVGCAVFEGVQEMSRETMRTFKAGGSDYKDFNEDEDDPYGYVGEIARGNEATVKEPDQWYRKNIMSARARNIEKNLGFE